MDVLLIPAGILLAATLAHLTLTYREAQQKEKRKD